MAVAAVAMVGFFASACTPSNYSVETQATSDWQFKLYPSIYQQPPATCNDGTSTVVNGQTWWNGTCIASGNGYNVGTIYNAAATQALVTVTAYSGRSDTETYIKQANGTWTVVDRDEG